MIRRLGWFPPFLRADWNLSIVIQKSFVITRNKSNSYILLFSTIISAEWNSIWLPQISRGLPWVCFDRKREDYVLVNGEYQSALQNWLRRENKVNKNKVL